MTIFQELNEPATRGGRAASGAGEETSRSAEHLRTSTAAMRLAFTWFGTRKTLSPQQKAQAAESFGAEGDYLSAGKKLLDVRHPKFRAVTGVRNRAVSYFKGVSLPFPEPGIRLIRQDDVGPVNMQMTTLKAELDEAVAELDQHFDELKAAARRRLTDPAPAVRVPICFSQRRTTHAEDHPIHPLARPTRGPAEGWLCPAEPQAEEEPETMLSVRELATVQAALRFWQEEMCPHGAEFARPYLEPHDVEPLSAVEIERLRERFDPQAVRYALYADGAAVLADLRLFAADEALKVAQGEVRVATVILSG